MGFKDVVRAVTPQALYAAARSIAKPRLYLAGAPAADLKIGALTPEVFQRARPASEAIDGMLSEFSMAVMDCLLDFQAAHAVAGHVVEFGVYKGRSAVVLAHRARAGERLVLVDIESYLERDAIARVFPAYEFVRCPAEKFPAVYPHMAELAGCCRFIHIDTSHGFRATIQELGMAESLLAPRGLIVLDDFTNLNFSQLIAGVYKYLFTARTDLFMYLVTDEKAYVCRRQDFGWYASFALNGLLEQMRKRGISHPVLSRSDVDEEYRAIHLRRALPGESGDLYGEAIYGHLYRDP